MGTERRTLLKGVILFVVAALLVIGLGYHYRRILYRRYLKLRLDETSSPGRLSAQEFKTLIALFQILAPAPGPSTQALRSFVDWRTMNVNGYYREYQDAVTLLDAYARPRFGTPFVQLTNFQQNVLLGEMLPQYTLLPLQESLPIEQAEPPGWGRKLAVAYETLVYRREARFKYFVFWDLLLFYWSSGEGWSVVGYTSFPGAPDQEPRWAYTHPPTKSLHKS